MKPARWSFDTLTTRRRERANNGLTAMAQRRRLGFKLITRWRLMESSVANGLVSRPCSLWHATRG